MTVHASIALGELFTEVQFAAAKNRWAHAVNVIQTAILDRRARAGLMRFAMMAAIFDTHQSASYAMKFWKRRAELLDEASLLEEVLEETRRRGQEYAVAQTTIDSKVPC